MISDLKKSHVQIQKLSMENFKHRKFLKTSSPVRFLEMVFSHTGHTNITNSEELQILFFEPLI